jgi:hypothetical protein
LLTEFKYWENLRPIGFISGDLKKAGPMAVLLTPGGENFADTPIRECLPEDIVNR